MLKTLHKLKVGFLVIESSPFLRSLQTAAAIATEIGIDQISVNYSYSEWLKSKWYPDGDPCDKLTILQMHPNQFSIQEL